MKPDAIQKISRARMELPYGFGPPSWREDPSYNWAAVTAAKRAQPWACPKACPQCRPLYCVGYCKG